MTGSWERPNYFLVLRVSICRHMVTDVLQSVSDFLPNTQNVSSNLLQGLQHCNTTFNRLLLGKQAQSVTEILLQMTHTLFILDSAAKEISPF